MESCISTKKAQIWGLDLVIAMIIFTIGILIFFFYTMNFASNSEETLDALFTDGNAIANFLLSEGSPNNWTALNVMTLGISSENKIDEAKLQNFYSLASGDYAKTKKLFDTKFDYYVYFTDPLDISGNQIDGIGKSGINRTNIEQYSFSNIVKVTRFTIYRNKPTQLNIYTWYQ